MLDRQDVIRENIRFARSQLGLKISELAAVTGVGVSTITNFENGHLKKISDRIAALIANGLNLSVLDLEDISLKDRYRANAARPTATEDDPLTAEFKKMLLKMDDRQRKQTLDYMKFQIWLRDNE